MFLKKYYRVYYLYGILVNTVLVFLCECMGVRVSIAAMGWQTLPSRGMIPNWRCKTHVNSNYLKAENGVLSNNDNNTKGTWGKEEFVGLASSEKVVVF